MAPFLVVIAPLLIMFFALLMNQVERCVVQWKPSTITQDGNLDIESLSDELAEQAETTSHPPSS